ncbi:hypothetical protein NMY22_g16437 [Coprinellus aureogranulatus]|nr:hypothetical protein NMY22_g16437 [Coprinellus aureogranulatus]
MEIFMRNVDWLGSHAEVVVLLAERLHHRDFLGDGRANQFNFHVHLFKDRSRRHRHSGAGTLTVRTTDIGERFLALYGSSGLPFKGNTIRFTRSKSQSGAIQLKNIDYITHNPYVDPRDPEAREKLEMGKRVGLQSIQFCWECRDQVLSIESEASPTDASVSFDKENRRIRVQFSYRGYNYYIVIHFSQIESLTGHTSLGESAIVFTLSQPPTYEQDLKPLDVNQEELDLDSILASFLGTFKIDDGGPARKQLSYLPLPENHQRVAPYTSLVLRLVCKSQGGPQKFADLSKDAGFPHISSDPWIVERRGLFSDWAFSQFSSSVEQFPWRVAFQMESILRNHLADVQEMLDIIPDIRALGRRRGLEYVASLLRDFSPRLSTLYREDARRDAVRRCFRQMVEEYDSQLIRKAAKVLDESLFESYHVIVTPTRLLLEGPTVERSNRVIRAYKPEHHHSFLRVSFAEEGRLQLRFDKEVDGAKYVESRVKPILFGGLEIAGRKFHFLAYSQSALKEHTVW